MSTISEIAKILTEIIKLEKKAEEAIASEKDINRRKKLEKAFKDRDLAALHDLMFPRK